jgi:hypothetical protein
MDAIRHIILHYHFFKNAGSTLARSLERNFAERFVLFDSAHYNRRIQPAELLSFTNAHPQILAISSHHLRPPAPKQDKVQFHEMLLLREPLDRLGSMYAFYRRATVTPDPLTQEAKRRTLRDFFLYLIDNQPNLVSNAQVNLIANGGAQIPDERDAEKATILLCSIPVLGVADDFDHFALVAEHCLRPSFPHLDLSYAPENVTPGRKNSLPDRLRLFASECGTTLFDKLQELNRLDTALVHAASEELQRRVEWIGFREIHLREFRRRIATQKRLYMIARKRLRLQRAWRRVKRFF